MLLQARGNKGLNKGSRSEEGRLHMEMESGEEL